MPTVLIRVAILLLIGVAFSVGSRGGFSSVQWLTHLAAYKLAFYGICAFLALGLMRARSRRQQLRNTVRPSLGSGRSDLDLQVPPARTREPIDRNRP